MPEAALPAGNGIRLLTYLPGRVHIDTESSSPCCARPSNGEDMVRDQKTWPAIPEISMTIEITPSITGVHQMQLPARVNILMS